MGRLPRSSARSRSRVRARAATCRRARRADIWTRRIGSRAAQRGLARAPARAPPAAALPESARSLRPAPIRTILALVIASGIALSIIADFTENVDDILRNRPSAASSCGTTSTSFARHGLPGGADGGPGHDARDLRPAGAHQRGDRRAGPRRQPLSASACRRSRAPPCSPRSARSCRSRCCRLRTRRSRKPRTGFAAGRSGVVRSPDKQWLFGQGRFMYNFLAFDERAASIQRLQVFEFDDQHRLVARLLADEASYSAAGWVFDGGWSRGLPGRRASCGRSTVPGEGRPARAARLLRRPGAAAGADDLQSARDLHRRSCATPASAGPTSKSRC